MTKYEIEQRKIVELKYGRQCLQPGCNEVNQGFAHILPNRKWTVKRYSFKVINHNSNLVPSCNKHNHLFQINATSEIDLKRQFQMIKYAMKMEQGLEE